MIKKLLSEPKLLTNISLVASLVSIVALLLPSWTTTSVNRIILVAVLSAALAAAIKLIASRNQLKQTKEELKKAKKEFENAPRPEESENGPAQVFISYAREDEDQVQRLYLRLREAGFRPWMDTVNLRPGENWIRAIEEAIHQSDFFLACISHNAIDKRGYIQKELKLSLDLTQQRPDENIFLIPVRLEDTEVPEPLSDFHTVDLFREGGFARLEKALRSRREPS